MWPPRNPLVFTRSISRRPPHCARCSSRSGCLRRGAPDGTMDQGAAAIEVREVSVLYGPHRVLDHVSLNAARGEFIALLGASGCGKTTLLRAICGFVPVADGAIVVDGR